MPLSALLEKTFGLLVSEQLVALPLVQVSAVVLPERTRLGFAVRLSIGAAGHKLLDGVAAPQTQLASYVPLVVIPQLFGAEVHGPLTVQPSVVVRHTPPTFVCPVGQHSPLLSVWPAGHEDTAGVTETPVQLPQLFVSSDLVMTPAASPAFALSAHIRM